MTNDEIRPAGPADVPAVKAVTDAAYEHYIERIGLVPQPMRRDHAANVAAGQVYVTGDPVVGLVVGIPIGLLIGREVWGRVADSLGVATVSTVPSIGLVLTGVGALVLVNAIGFFPGRAASRTRPAVALRSE